MVQALLNKASLSSLVEESLVKVIRGELKTAQTLLDLFDVFKQSKNVTIIDPQHGKIVVEE